MITSIQCLVIKEFSHVARLSQALAQDRRHHCGQFRADIFLGTMAPTLEPARLTLDILSWPIDGATTFASPDTRFLSALTGGFLFGWGVMIWCLSAWVLLLSGRSGGQRKADNSCREGERRSPRFGEFPPCIS